MREALQALLEGAIDYAGLFPPAAHDMSAAVREYAEHLASPDAWALGRFVVPVARLSELAREGGSLFPEGETAAPWRLSALLGGADLETELATVADFNDRHARGGGIVPDGVRGGAMVDIVEARVSSPDEVARIAEAVPERLTLYLEIPTAADPEPFVAAIAQAGARAKLRTGGLTADAFPDAARLARFVATCARADVPFKATAGLHHPLRGEYRLTYDAGAERGTMQGADEVELAAILDERAPAAIAIDAGGARWGDRRLSLESLRRARGTMANAFGSCSFREPMDELRGLALL
jgi:hypothetical protein